MIPDEKVALEIADDLAAAADTLYALKESGWQSGCLQNRKRKWPCILLQPLRSKAGSQIGIEIKQSSLRGFPCIDARKNGPS